MFADTTGHHAFPEHKNCAGLQFDMSCLVQARIGEWNNRLEIRNKDGAGFHNDPRALRRRQVSGRVNLCCRLLGEHDAGTGIDMNNRVDIVTAKQSSGALHQNQMSETRKIRIEKACDLEWHFAIAVSDGSSSISNGKCDIEPALAADFRYRNGHAGFSNKSSCRIHEITASTPSCFLRFVKTYGREPRIMRESRSMTARSAPTKGARSVLLITRRSERVMPGPPLRGILSPPATSI